MVQFMDPDQAAIPFYGYEIQGTVIVKSAVNAVKHGNFKIIPCVEIKINLNLAVLHILFRYGNIIKASGMLQATDRYFFAGLLGRGLERHQITGRQA